MDIFEQLRIELIKRNRKTSKFEKLVQFFSALVIGLIIWSLISL